MIGTGSPAALLHRGAVMHVRHAPFRHRFAYRLWMLSVDLDRLAEVRSWLFGHNRAAPVTLRDRDHGPRDGSALRPWVEAHLREAGLETFGHSLHLMAMPRVFGFGFNPIAFFFCYDAAGRLGAVVHQVKNTFGDQIAYTLPVPEPSTGPLTGNGPTIRQATAKRLHVSPFFDVKGGYRFSFSAPDLEDGRRPFHLAIRYGADDAARLTATMRLLPQAFSTRALLHLLLALPLVPLKVVAAIHWQALRLWLRGAVFHSRPPIVSGDPA